MTRFLGSSVGELVDAAEIADRLGVRHRTVHMWIFRKLLPDPETRFGGVPIWRWVDIEQWARDTGRLS